MEISLDISVDVVNRNSTMPFLLTMSPVIATTYDMPRKPAKPAPPKPGRPRSELTYRFQVRCSDEEREDWDARANREELDLSAWARRAIRRAVDAGIA